MTVGETVSAKARGLVQRAWGVPLKDSYSCEEAGYLTMQCPDHEVYHVQSENVLLEVVDDDGRPCGPGETGRVLITSLHNFATPLIRYELGDYRSEEHTSELQSLMRISYAVFCLKKKNTNI